MTGDLSNTTAHTTEGVPASTVTLESIMGQIEDVNRKANRLIEGLIEQRDDARAVLIALANLLEYRDGDDSHVQVIPGRGPHFWELLLEIKRNAT